jgi:2-(1,2-epoxy-1,2-dihydrophenyl)acetyl-CoA isomerase
MEHVRVERSEGVGTVTLDRMGRFNSLDATTAQDLRAATLALARDAAVGCIVLEGRPGAFCTGVDLKYVRAGGDAELDYLTPGGRPPGSGYGRVFKQVLEYLHSTISEIRRAPKPVIAVVDGVAAAGGFGLAMCCDLVYASDRASFEWAYGRTALSGAERTTFLLPRLIGLRAALGLVLLNPRLDPWRARDIGLVTAVHPAAALAAEVAAVARELAAGPTAAWAAGKALLNRAAGMDRLDHHLDQELAALVRSADSPEFAAGLDAFFTRKERPAAPAVPAPATTGEQP